MGVERPRDGHDLGTSPFDPVGEREDVTTPMTRRPFSAELVDSHPHDPSAFTQGLAYLGDGLLLESTGRESTLRKVDLMTGAVLSSVDLPPNHFGEGVAVVGAVAYQLTWKSGVAFAYRVEDLAKLGEFRYVGEGWGLTSVGGRLIMSDGSNMLRFRDPVTFAITDELLVTDRGRPVRRLNDLAVVDDVVFANVWPSSRIAQIDISTGEVIEWLDLAWIKPASSRQVLDAVLNGLAFDDRRGRLIATGKLWPALFEFVLRR